MTASRLFVLLIAGALAYALYTGKISNPLPRGGTFWKPYRRSTPAQIRDHPALIRGLSQQILVPLENPQAPTTESAQSALAGLTTEVNAQPATADFDRSRRSLALISMALQERQSFISQALAKAPDNPLDQVPGVWHDAMHRDKVLDLPKLKDGVSLRNSAGIGAGSKKMVDRPTVSCINRS